ncbi:MAG: TRAP transporter fused permease subunit [Rhodospirillales bacterium]|nr:TRAP transporter fused permease subunit [Rhodospirillales bacterium]
MNAHAQPQDAAPNRAPAPLLRAVQACFIAYALFHLYTSLFGMLEPLSQRGLFIGGGIGFVFFGLAADRWRRAPLAAIGDLVLGLAGAYGGLYVTLHADRLMDIMNDLTPVDMAMGVMTILVALEAARRTIGLSLPIMAVISLAFYLLGNHLIGGNWRPPRVSFETAISTLYASTGGLFGLLADIGTRVVAIYVVMGSLLMALGAGDVFMRAATLVAGRAYGGPAKVAVVTSALFGTISGSAVANVMSVGSITIPTMIRAGYRKGFAAGIEATASAGGQIMPPVMGAGAFIMAELLNIPYTTIAAAAAIPAVLYFSAIYFSIDCYARGNHLMPIPRHEVPRARDVFLSLDALVAFGPLVLLVWLLALDFTPTFAGGAATLALIAAAALVRAIVCLRDRRAPAEEARRFLLQLWEGLADGGKSVVVIAALLATASLLVTVLSATGLGVKFSQLLLSFSGEHLVGVLLVAAGLCIILGMDVPTTASYLLTASVVGPVLVKLGLAPLTAHLYIFYFAILSAITPPVCASVYAAATIAGENFWTVAGQALRIAGAVFLIPFMMVYRPELTMNGSFLWIVYSVAICWTMVVAISGASIGFLLGPLRWPERLYLYAGAAALFYPTFYADGVGVVMIGLFLAVRRFRGPARRLA